MYASLNSYTYTVCTSYRTIIMGQLICFFQFPFRSRSIPVQFNWTEIEQERNGTGMGMEQEWNGNGTGMEWEWNGNGTGMERKLNKSSMGGQWMLSSWCLDCYMIAYELGALNWASIELLFNFRSIPIPFPLQSRSIPAPFLFHSHSIPVPF